MTGYHNNIIALREKYADGRVKIERDGSDARFSGSTYDHKEFLKRELGCRWDRETKSWVATNLNDSYLYLLDDIMGIED